MKKNIYKRKQNKKKGKLDGFFVVNQEQPWGYTYRLGTENLAFAAMICDKLVT